MSSDPLVSFDAVAADEGLVSVIVIFFNGSRYIEEAIDSVIAQGYRNWELLLADDGSTDASTAIAMSYEARYPGRVRYLEHEGHANRGMSATRNLGIRAAKGEFIAFIDSDDVWVPSKLAEQVAIMRRQPQLGMVCGTVLYWRSWSGGEDEIIPSGPIFDRSVAPPQALLSVYPLGSANAPCPSDVLLRAAVVREVGGFEEHFTHEKQAYEDQGFFSKLYLAAPVYFSTSVWLKYRQHAESCVSSVRRAGQYDAVRHYYLRWLQGYLRDRSQLVGPVKRAIDRALWRFRHPWIHLAGVALPLRVLKKILRTVGASSLLNAKRTVVVNPVEQLQVGSGKSTWDSGLLMLRLSALDPGRPACAQSNSGSQPTSSDHILLGMTIAGSTDRIAAIAGEKWQPSSIVVEPSDYVLRNVGDMAMMQIAIERLNAMWPRARIRVLTDDPGRLKLLCPIAEPLSGSGRALWLTDDHIPYRLKRWISGDVADWLRANAPIVQQLLWRLKLRHDRPKLAILTEYTQAIVEADLLVVCGMGGITDAFPEYAGDLLKALVSALAWKKPFVLVGQGIGPLRDQRLRQLAKQVLPQAQMITLREGASGVPLLNELGVSQQRIHVTGDDALEIAYRARGAVMGNGLGVNLRSSAYSAVDLHVTTQVGEVIGELLREFDAPAIPIPISTVPGEADIDTIRQVLSSAGVAFEPKRDTTSNSPSDVIELIQRCRVVVTGSYHAGVFACGSGIPTVCIARSPYYVDKFKGLAALFGKGCQAVSAETPEFKDRLRQAIRTCWQLADQVRPDLLNRAARQIAQGRAAYGKIGEVSAAGGLGK